jgi:hypothetical protein
MERDLRARPLPQFIFLLIWTLMSCSDSNGTHENGEEPASQDGFVDSSLESIDDGGLAQEADELAEEKLFEESSISDDSGGSESCKVTADTILATDSVGPAWIPLTSPIRECLENADLVYTNRITWDVYVMDEWGGNQQCLTCYSNNVLGVNFPLDEDEFPPDIHWKGGPEPHPTQPIIIFKAENENSAHVQPDNVPTIGWDVDIWALNVCTKSYVRLVDTLPQEGVQASALSNDGKIYAYPRRYERGNPPKDFGFAKISINEFVVDVDGDSQLIPLFEDEPNGQMYYEPNDIQLFGAEEYWLAYVAGTNDKCDPYLYTFTCHDAACVTTSNHALDTTPLLHEEFIVFSPNVGKLALMKGPTTQGGVGVGYEADLYVAKSDYSEMSQISYYNDCGVWPDSCLDHKGQLARLSWKDDGRAIFFGLWKHGQYVPLREGEVHRIDFSGVCGD